MRRHIVESREHEMPTVWAAIVQDPLTLNGLGGYHLVFALHIFLAHYFGDGLDKLRWSLPEMAERAQFLCHYRNLTHPKVAGYSRLAHPLLVERLKAWCLETFGDRM